MGGHVEEAAAYSWGPSDLELEVSVEEPSYEA